jgi:hypothetical protein
MRLMALAVAAAFALCAASVAQAQQQQPPRQKRAVQTSAAPGPPGTYVMSRDENGRVRTKILVQKRSYLDGGTEVMPGDNVDSFRSSFMRGQPSAITQGTAFDRPSWVNDPTFLQGKNSPYPWFPN